MLFRKPSEPEILPSTSPPPPNCSIITLCLLSVFPSAFTGREIIGNFEKSRILVDVRYSLHVIWVPCHQGMARPQVKDGEVGIKI
jgi:hypothetical protein